MKHISETRHVIKQQLELLIAEKQVVEGER